MSVQWLARFYATDTKSLLLYIIGYRYFNTAHSTSKPYIDEIGVICKYIYFSLPLGSIFNQISNKKFNVLKQILQSDAYFVKFSNIKFKENFVKFVS